MRTTATHADVEIEVEGQALPGTLTIPSGARGMVVFVHGSGSSRLSPRNRAVAAALVERGCATLLFDLLTEAEALDRRNVFDIALLGARVEHATRWLREQPAAFDLRLGYFGASTGAAAALVAAAEVGDLVTTVVSRGGRPDLAGAALPRVQVPVLLVVGALDTEVLRLNRAAQAQLTCPSELHVIEGATHLFEEPGTLDEVSQTVGRWFVERFAAEHPE